MLEKHRAKFLEFARRNAAKESCALLIIENGREELLLCKNISPYNQQFEIDPIDFLIAEKRGEIIGVVHSHPFGKAFPSEIDRVSCQRTNLKWFICGCIDGDWYDLKPKIYQVPLIGREWSHGILDCYSLVRDYYKQNLKIELEDYEREPEWWLKGHDLYAKNIEKGGFFEVDLMSIQPHDVILMQIESPVINHAGIFLGQDSFLHHVQNRLSSRDLFGGLWLKSTEKIIRHRSFLV